MLGCVGLRGPNLARIFEKFGSMALDFVWGGRGGSLVWDSLCSTFFVLLVSGCPCRYLRLPFCEEKWAPFECPLGSVWWHWILFAGGTSAGRPRGRSPRGQEPYVKSSHGKSGIHKSLLAKLGQAYEALNRSPAEGDHVSRALGSTRGGR